MERLKTMKENLMSCAESQMMNLAAVDAEELGEVIDMIKDLEEAMYYCSIVKAMEEPETPKYYTYPYPVERERERDMDIDRGRMYYTPIPHPSEEIYYYTEPTGGKSAMQRKMYMEAKEQHHDKATQLRELEKYMDDLCEDMTEMIADASPEERQFFERKLTQLAQKMSNV